MKKLRHEIIRNMLQTKPYVSLHELEEAFPNVSGMTLRRDIEYFEKIGEAIKVRGGARSMKFITTSMEDAFSLRLNSNMTAKQKIALAAMDYIETGRSIFLDSGTTILKLAAIIPDERISVLTTGPNVALELVKKNLPIINLVGGMINRDNISISGSQAISFIENINIDTAFLVPSGFSLENGFTSGNYSECEFKSYICEKAKKTVILADSSKLDKNLPYTFAGFSDIDVIITDEEVSSEFARAARAAKIKLVIA